MGEMDKPLDYYVDITVSDDKLNAYLQISNCDDQFSVTKEQLDQLLKSNRIVYGIDEGMLLEIARDPKPFFNKRTVIATGGAAKDGVNGSIRYLFDLDDKSKRPMETEDGKVDYKEVTAIHNARKGQLIAERIPAAPGVEGKAVTGEKLFAKDGKEARFKLGKNVVTDPEQNAVYAAIDGIVTKTDRDKVNVFPIFEVNGDVDYNIGNIDFVGSVVIRGNVLPGFKIRAEGDIRVTGNVDGADLEAGGSIEINAGILGHHKGTIRAGKRIKCSFVQDAIIEAGEEVVVNQSILHSQVRAGTSVVCKGTKGLIVGGVIQAGDSVVARTVGNSMSTVTVIEVGILPDLRQELQQLRAQLRSLTENFEKTDKALALLDQLAAAGQLGPEKVAMRIKLNHTKKQVQEEITSSKERMLQIERTLEESELAKVEVISNVYSGTKIVIGRFTRFIKDTSPRVKFYLADGDVAMVPL